jgi:hypothetical protein
VPSKSVRLNGSLRERAINALFDHGARVQREKLREDGNTLYQLAYDELVPKEHRKLMAKLPENYFAESDHLAVNANGWTVQLARKDEQTNAWGQFKAVPVRMPDALIPHWQTALPVSTELGAAVQAFAQREKKLKEDLEALKGKITSLVSSFSTLDKLLEAVPELRELDPVLASTQPETKALAPLVKDVMCSIAGLRGEDREGCDAPEQVAA